MVDIPKKVFIDELKHMTAYFLGKKTTQHLSLSVVLKKNVISLFDKKYFMRMTQWVTMTHNVL